MSFGAWILFASTRDLTVSLVDGFIFEDEDDARGMERELPVPMAAGDAMLIDPLALHWLSPSPEEYGSGRLWVGYQVEIPKKTFRESLQRVCEALGVKPDPDLVDVFEALMLERLDRWNADQHQDDQLLLDRGREHSPLMG